jgi:protein tyrosine/serine phosphatase
VLAAAGYGQLSAPRIGNFGEVTAGAIYRGAQPSDQGLRDLVEFGVKTVIDLRGDSSAIREKGIVEALHMQFIHVPMNGLTAPTNAQIAQLMRILETAPQPVFIHCQHGEDRSGTVVACWRISHDHWPNDKALKEAKAYHINPVQIGMKRFIASYSPPQ